MRSCQLPVGSIGKSRITTIEQIGKTDIGARAAGRDPDCGRRGSGERSCRLTILP